MSGNLRTFSKRNLRRGAWLSSLVLLVLAAASCDDDRHIVIPESGSGVIEGYVTDGLPIDPRDVTVTALDYDRADLDFIIQVHPDSTGHYALTVPNGPTLVVMRADCGRDIYFRRDGLTHSRADADTVLVAGEVYRVDFPCGRVAVDVGLPPEVQGRSVRCGLVSFIGTSTLFDGCTYAVESRLTTELRLIKPGDYLVAVHTSNYGTAYLPATLDTAAAAVIEVRPGEEARHTSEIPALTVLSGAVTGSWQAFGCEPPRVEAWHDGRRVMDIPADDDGDFDVRLLGGGTVQLLVAIAGVPGYVGGVDLASATVFDLATGEHRTGVTHVESGLELAFVGDADPDQLQFRYDVYDGTGRVVTRFPNNTSSLQGSTNPLRIPNLPPGEVYLRVVPASLSMTWMPQFYDRRDSLAAADPVTVPAGGQIVQATMTLERGGRIFGRLFTVDGMPCPPWQVDIRLHASDDPSSYLLRYTTDWLDFYDWDTGEYVLTQIPDGAYKVRARHSVGLFGWYPGEEAWDDAGVVVIENHADVTLDDWRLPH